MTTVKQLEKELNNFYATTGETLKNLTEMIEQLMKADIETQKKLQDHQKRFELIYQYNQNHEKLRHQSENRNRPGRYPDNDYYDEYENRRHNYNERNR